MTGDDEIECLGQVVHEVLATYNALKSRATDGASVVVTTLQ